MVVLQQLHPYLPWQDHILMKVGARFVPQKRHLIDIKPQGTSPVSFQRGYSYDFSTPQLFSFYRQYSSCSYVRADNLYKKMLVSVMNLVKFLYHLFSL